MYGFVTTWGWTFNNRNINKWKKQTKKTLQEEDNKISGASNSSIFSWFILVNFLSSEATVNKSSLQLLKQASYDISLQPILQLRQSASLYAAVNWFVWFCLRRHLIHVSVGCTLQKNTFLTQSFGLVFSSNIENPFKTRNIF